MAFLLHINPTHDQQTSVSKAETNLIIGGGSEFGQKVPTDHQQQDFDIGHWPKMPVLQLDKICYRTVHSHACSIKQSACL